MTQFIACHLVISKYTHEKAKVLAHFFPRLRFFTYNVTIKMILIHYLLQYITYYYGISCNVGYPWPEGKEFFVQFS